jgi:hypothetical protein
MTGRSDTVVYDCEFEVYRIRAGESVLLGTEYGGCPCGWDTRTGALETVERHAEMAAYLRWLRDTRWLA